MSYLLRVWRLLIQHILPFIPTRPRVLFRSRLPRPSPNPVVIEVFDLRGKVVLQLDFQATSARPISMNLKHVAKGLYFVALSDGTHRRVEKLVVD